MKRRKFATAAAFLAALLVAALAAASVSAATSSHKSAAVSGKGWSKGAGHNLTPKLAGTGSFKPSAPRLRTVTCAICGVMGMISVFGFGLSPYCA